MVAPSTATARSNRIATTAQILSPSVIISCTNKMVSSFSYGTMAKADPRTFLQVGRPKSKMCCFHAKCIYPISQVLAYVTPPFFPSSFCASCTLFVGGLCPSIGQSIGLGLYQRRAQYLAQGELSQSGGCDSKHQSSGFSSRGFVYGRIEIRHWGGGVLLGALAFDNYYYSALFAGLVGLTGLVLIDFKRLGQYLRSGVVMLGLFAPHLSITLYQAQNADGHLWYGVPTPDFFSQHLQYLTHYSPLVMGIMGAVALMGMGLSLLQRQITQPAERAPAVWTLRVVAAFWFVTPAVLGYWYSVTYSPILRPSHLLFSFPYGLLLIFSGWSQTKQAAALSLAVVVLLGGNTWTLMDKRQHFKVVHTHPYEHFVVHTQAFLEKHSSDQVTIVLGENPDYLQYYKEAHQADFSHYRSFKPDIAFTTFKEQIEKGEATPYLIVGALPAAHLQYALRTYPHILQYKNGVNYDYYILAKQPEAGSWIMDYHCGEAVPAQPSYQTYWTIAPYHWQTDSTGERYYEWAEEWGPTYDGELEELLPNGRHSIVDVHAQLRSAVDSIPLEGTLVVEVLTDQDSSLLWRGVNVAEQSTSVEGWQDLYLSLRLVHEPAYPPKANIRAFFWNREKQVVQLARFDICTRRDNPLLYKDTQPF